MKQPLRLSSVFILLYLALFPSVLRSQEKPSKNASDSCREFVREFYSWYLANAPKWNQGRPSDVALKFRSNLFSSAIVQALREDDAAQEKAGSDLVSLEGDPFVGADGFAERYIVGKVTTAQGQCWAEVHGVWDGKEDQTPDVIPELAIRNHKWHFVNFYFPTPSNPKGWDLLSALRALREEEKQYGAGKVQKP